MKIVYKYAVPASQHVFSMSLPKNFKTLRVAYQNERLCMWCEVDPKAEKVETKFSIFGTGQDIPDSAVYVTTWDSGPFVWHLYRL